jgi:hypothetical protein
MNIRRMRIACWLTKATDTHSAYVIILLFLRNNGSTTAPGRYICILRTLPVLLKIKDFWEVTLCHCGPTWKERDAFIFFG